MKYSILPLFLLLACTPNLNFVGTWSKEFGSMTLVWSAESDGTCMVETLGTPCTWEAFVETERFTLIEPTDPDCGVDEGVYRYDFSTEDAFTFDLVSDSCDSLPSIGFPDLGRADLVVGEWVRK